MQSPIAGNYVGMVIRQGDGGECGANGALHSFSQQEVTDNQESSYCDNDSHSNLLDLGRLKEQCFIIIPLFVEVLNISEY